MKVLNQSFTISANTLMSVERTLCRINVFTTLLRDCELKSATQLSIHLLRVIETRRFQKDIYLFPRLSFQKIEIYSGLNSVEVYLFYSFISFFFFFSFLFPLSFFPFSHFRKLIQKFERMFTIFYELLKKIAQKYEKLIYQ